MSSRSNSSGSFRPADGNDPSLSQSANRERFRQSRKRHRSESFGHSRSETPDPAYEERRAGYRDYDLFGRSRSHANEPDSKRAVLPSKSPSRRGNDRSRSHGEGSPSGRGANQRPKSRDEPGRVREEAPLRDCSDRSEFGRPGILGDYHGNARPVWPSFSRDMTMSSGVISLPELSQLSKEQVAMLPHNLQMLSTYERDSQRHHPWEDILSNREHPSPLFGRPSAQRFSPVFGSASPGDGRYFDDGSNSYAGPSSLFGGSTSRFRPDFHPTTSSFAKSRFGGLERNESPPNVDRSALNASNVYERSSGPRGHDLDDISDEDDDDDVFTRSHRADDSGFKAPPPLLPVHGRDPSDTARLRLPSRDYLQKLSLDFPLRKYRGDDDYLARSRSADDDCMIVESEPCRPKTALVIEKSWYDADKRGTVSESDQAQPPTVDKYNRREAESVYSQFISRDCHEPLPAPPTAIAQANGSFPTARAPTNRAQALMESAVDGGVNAYSPNGSAVVDNSSPSEVSKDSPDAPTTDPDAKTGVDGLERENATEAVDEPVPVVDENLSDAPTDDSYDSARSDIEKDIFSTCADEIKTFCFGEDYVLDDAPNQPSTNFFDGPFQSTGSSKSVATPPSLFPDVPPMPEVARRPASSLEGETRAHREHRASLLNDVPDVALPSRSLDDSNATESAPPESKGSHPATSEPPAVENQQPIYDTVEDYFADRMKHETMDHREKNRINHILSFCRNERTATSRPTDSPESPVYSESDFSDDNSSYDHENDYAYSPSDRIYDGYDDDYYDDDDEEVVLDGSDEEEVLWAEDSDGMDVEDDGNITEVLSGESEEDAPRELCESSSIDPAVSFRMQVVADVERLVDEMVVRVGRSSEDERRVKVSRSSAKSSILSSEELEDEILIFLSDIINEIDPSLKLNPAQTDAYDELYPAIVVGPPDTVLINDKELEVSVTRCSLKTLIEEVPYKKLTAKSHVNDEIINSYMNLLRHRSNKFPELLPKVFTFSTFFFESLRNGGHDRVKRWTRGKDIFQYDLILIPLNFKTEHHWALFIIDLNAKIFVHYDSLLNRDLTKFKHLKLTKQVKIVNLFRDYLVKELAHKQSSYDLSLKCFKVDFCAKYPEQRNLIDCGVFCMRFAEGYTRRGYIEFCQAEMLHYRKQICLELFDLEVPVYSV